MIYLLRLLTYEWEAEQKERNVHRSFLKGMEKVHYTELDQSIEGEAKNVESSLTIFQRKTYEEARDYVKAEIRGIRKENPLLTIDFTFSEYREKGPNRVIYKDGI